MMRICKTSWAERSNFMSCCTIVLEVLLGPHDEEGVPFVDLEEFLEGVVATVEHVIRTRLVGNLAHPPGIVNRGLRGAEERWNGSLQIVRKWTFTPPFRFRNLAHQKTDAHVVALRLMGLQRNNQVAQTFAVAELAKYHDK